MDSQVCEFDQILILNNVKFIYGRMKSYKCHLMFDFDTWEIDVDECDKLFIHFLKKSILKVKIGTFDS